MRICRRKIHVADDKEIEIAVRIVIKKARTGRPIFIVWNAGRFGYVLEFFARIFQKPIVALVICQENIREAVVINVADGDALAVARAGQVPFIGLVGESAFAVIDKKFVFGVFGTRFRFDRTAVDKQNVGRAVAVKIRNRHAASHNFGHKFFLRAGRNMFEIHTARFGCVRKFYRCVCFIGLTVRICTLLIVAGCKGQKNKN